MNKKLKSQQGAVSVLVIITVLTFSTILLGAYLSITTLRKSQVRSDIRIQEIYGKTLNEVDDIYEGLYINNIGELPNGYTRVEYIQGTGTQYTVIDNLSTTDFGFDIEMSATTGTGANVFGGFKQGNSTFCYMGTRNNKISYFPNESKVDFVSTTDYENKHDYKLIKDEDDEFKYYYDGNFIGTSSLVNNAGSTIGIFTFVDNNGVARTSASEVFRGKIYKFTIYDGKNIVCNLIPCIKDSNSKPGFYDTVNDKFYSSLGTNEFEIPNYTITYNLDGGTVATANPIIYSEDTASFTLNNPTKTGHTFIGWTGSNGNSPQTTVTIANGTTGNKTYTANWLSEYRYIKIEILKIKRATNCIQLSEFAFYDENQNRYSFPQGTSITASLTEASSSESISKIIDNNVETKYCSTQWGNQQDGYCVIDIDLGQNNYIDISQYGNYAYYTGNDATERDPISWILTASTDGTNYDLLDMRLDQTITDSRKTKTQSWELSILRHGLGQNDKILIYNPCGGNVNPTYEFKPIGGVLGQLPTPTNASKTSFTGWYTQEFNGQAITNSTLMSNNHMQAFAHWTSTSTNILFDVNDGGLRTQSIANGWEVEANSYNSGGSATDAGLSIDSNKNNGCGSSYVRTKNKIDLSQYSKIRLYVTDFSRGAKLYIDGSSYMNGPIEEHNVSQPGWIEYTISTNGTYYIGFQCTGSGHACTIGYIELIPN